MRDWRQAALLAFFRAAHLFFMPSLIRFLDAAESRLLPFRTFLPFLPCNAAMAISNRLRSASNSAMILSVSTMVRSSSKDSTRCLALVGLNAAKILGEGTLFPRYELAANGLNFNHLDLGGLHSAYVRGEAFMAARRYLEAAAEFQRILDHRGIVGLDPIGALAHLQLARTRALSGDNVRARSAYEDFLALWKDADPDIPVLKQAKAEYAKLQ